MALLFMDGFDNQDATTRYAYAGRLSAYQTSVATRFNAGAAVNLDHQGFLVKSIPASSKVIVGLAFKGTNGTYDGPIVTFIGDSGSVEHISLSTVNSTTWAIYRAGTQLMTFAAIAVRSILNIVIMVNVMVV